jgi:hypothetical protein
LEIAPGPDEAQAAFQAGLWNAVIRAVQKLWIMPAVRHIIDYIPLLTLSPGILRRMSFATSLAGAGQCA